jgi:hypothetical protein
MAQLHIISFSETTTSFFDFVECSTTRKLIINGIWALHQLGDKYWEWVYNFEVDPTRGFMFTIDSTLTKIYEQMEMSNAPFPVFHSGASFAFTMREMQYIARNGIESYRDLYFQRKREREEKRERE